MGLGQKEGVMVQQIALFLVFLTLSIPLVSSQALAASITSVSVTGSAGIEDVMEAENDYFTATVALDEEVSPEDLRFIYTDDVAFDSCEGTTCTYTSPQTDRFGQDLGYNIRLIQESVVVDEYDGVIAVDEVAPEVEAYTVEKEGDALTLDYEVRDTACEGCDACAGLTTLRILEDDIEVDSLDLDGCFVADSLETTTQALNLADGEHQLCVQAVDALGKESDAVCSLVVVDSAGPHFETGSLQVVDTITGKDVFYVGDDPILVSVLINVTDESLNPSTVRADLSALNGVVGETYSDMPADSCVDVGEGTYACSWEGLYVEEVTGVVSLTFSASDNADNEGFYTPTYALAQDTMAPVVYAVYTDQGDDIWLKSGLNTIYADLDSTGSGFAFEDVSLSLPLVGLNNEDPVSCVDAGGFWTCVWNLTFSYGGTTQSSLVIEATDDAGNSMEPYDVEVHTDSDEPEILSIETNLECPTAADVFTVEVNVTDSSDAVFVRFYGEDVRRNDEPIEEECMDIGDDTFTCLLTVSDLVTYPEDEDVVIEVVDLAGNIGEDDVDVDVCELEDAGTPDFVSLYVDDPAPVDALTLSYIDYPLYVPLEYSMASGASIVSQTATCDGASEVYFLGEDLMVVSLGQQSVANISQIVLGCTMYMTMQYGDKVYASPEVEEFSLFVDTYGTPLGSVEESIAEKIALQRQGIDDAEKRIKTLVTLNTIVGVLCKLADMMVKVNAVIAGVQVVITALGAIPFLRPLATAFSVFGSVFDGVMMKFIWSPGILFFSVGSIAKYACIIYTGKICEGFNGIENDIIIDAKEFGTQQYIEAQYEGNSAQANLLTNQKFKFFSDWDPYKSIHTAKSCFYLEAVIYNMRKERQINCMYATCLDENSQTGLPTDVCDVQFAERECLYVEGAAWHAGGSAEFFHFLQLFGNTILSNLDVFAMSFAYSGLCSAYVTSVGGTGVVGGVGGLPISTSVQSYPGMVYFATCHASGAALSLTETSWFTKSLDWNFKAELEGTDYCEGY